ncbi:hypothetical protein XBO1_2450017 [Xenorhabdus bovienii str. oregonense]|uniref:Uncharacterized protein n=1 Tax=Xenorhabdus bovienii str. oregonense TaxID=1398202 RepID=A0A077P7H3_XENBV|nr:hypothetical protein XBO1_2450017 [Xenorhabdus bovienii str. oregonense]
MMTGTVIEEQNDYSGDEETAVGSELEAKYNENHSNITDKFPLL